jgi:hypothetical protein
VIAAVTVFVILALVGGMLHRAGARVLDWILPGGINYYLAEQVARLCIRLAGTAAARDAATDLLANLKTVDRDDRASYRPLAECAPVLRRSVGSARARSFVPLFVGVNLVGASAAMGVVLASRAPGYAVLTATVSATAAVTFLGFVTGRRVSRRERDRRRAEGHPGSDDARD